MTRHKYYVIEVVPCPKCNGTKVDPELAGDSELALFMFRCSHCNEQGEVEVEVPLVEALAALQVRGMLPRIGG